VFAKQKESYISQLTKADAVKQELEKQVHDLDEQLVRVANEVSQRQQRAADKGEQLDQQLHLLRKVLCDMFLISLCLLLKVVARGTSRSWTGRMMLRCSNVQALESDVPCTRWTPTSCSMRYPFISPAVLLTMFILQDNAELKSQVRSVEKLGAEAEQALATAEKAHSEEANRLRRISKKTAEDLEEAQLQLKAAQERLSTVELQWQQASQELAVATAQLDALQTQGFKADSAIAENTRLKQVCAALSEQLVWLHYHGALCSTHPTNTYKVALAQWAVRPVL
jgi:hypothetical protein